MKKKIIVLCILLCTLVLEILPYGAVCNFANPEGPPHRVTYSYFSMIPYGYGDFGPLITAIFTCILLVITILSIILKKDWSQALLVISVIATLTSLAPLLIGLDNFSVVGAIISLSLIAATVVVSLRESDIFRFQ